MNKALFSVGSLLFFGACTIKTSDDGTGGSSAGGETAQGGIVSPGGSAAHGGSPQGGTANSKSSGGTSSGGAGGVAEGGKRGDLGTGGGVNLAGDSCNGAEPTSNDTRDSATPYQLGTSYHACLQDTKDVDVYSLQIPDDARGGYVQLSITDVGAGGDVSAAVYATADNGKFCSTGTNSDGGSIYLWFTAKPGAKFYIPVTNYSDVRAPNAYTFKVTYTQVPDTHEPNDLRTQAAPITVGTPSEGFMSAGWENSTGVPQEDWADWYKVDLTAADAKVLLSITASDNDGEIVLYDSLGTQVASKGTNTDGSSVELDYAVSKAGTYYIKVTPYSAPMLYGTTATLPQFLTIPYSLVVTQ